MVAELGVIDLLTADAFEIPELIDASRFPENGQRPVRRVGQLHLPRAFHAKGTSLACNDLTPIPGLGAANA